LQLASVAGADAVVDAGRSDSTETLLSAAGRHFDVALEMSGAASAIEQALHCLRPGGWISLLGLPVAPVTLDLNELVIQKGVTVHGIFGRRIWETWENTRRLLSPGGGVDVIPLITHRISLEDVEEAMQLLQRGESGKIVIYPQGAP
jgi:threonine 3-dehydrogenase